MKPKPIYEIRTLDGWRRVSGRVGIDGWLRYDAGAGQTAIVAPKRLPHR